MKHSNDPGTIEMFATPKRRGRPPLGKAALTPAQRAKRYRSKIPDRFGGVLANPQDASVVALCDTLVLLSKFVSTEAVSLLAPPLIDELSKRFPKPKK